MEPMDARAPIPGAAAPLVALALAWGTAPLLAARQEVGFTFEATGLDRPTGLVVADLVADPSPEVAVADRAGNLIVFDAATGELLASARHPEGASLTAPVAGDFLGLGRLDLAVATSAGEILLHDGSRLRVASRFVVPGARFEMPPGVFPLAQRADAPRDSIVAVDESGRVVAVQADSSGRLRLLWPAVSTGSAPAAPPAWGGFRDDGARSLVVAARDGSIWLVDPESGHGERALPPGGPDAAGALVVDDVLGDGRAELLIAFEGGGAAAFAWREGGFEPVWLAETPRPAGDPVLLRHPSTGDARLFIPHPGGLRVLDAATGATAGDAALGDPPPLRSHLAALPRDGDAPALLFTLGRSLVLMETGSFFGEALDAEPSSWPIGQGLAGTLALALVEPDGPPRIHAIGASPEGRLLVAALPGLAPQWPTSPWTTRGGTPRRTSTLDEEFRSAEENRRMAWEAIVASRGAQLDRYLRDGAWESAYAEARWLLEADPRNEELLGVFRSLWWRTNAFWVALAGLSLSALAASALLAARLLRRRRRLWAKAKAALAEGRRDDAEALLDELHQIAPRERAALGALAECLAARTALGARPMAVYRAALAAGAGSEEPILQGLAEAMAAAGRADEEALRIYLRARPGVADPAPIDAAIGRCHHAAGRMEEAAKSLRAAQRGGDTNPGTHALLCHILLSKGDRSAKAAPAYRREYQRLRHDAKFLECCLDACLDARHPSDRIEAICLDLLALRPSHAKARLTLAAIHLRANRTDDALREARQALEADSSSPEAKLLLAHCHLVRGGSDDAARAAYEAALEADPDDGEILRALAALLNGEARTDPRSKAVFRRAAEAFPGDIEALQGLARCAERDGDHLLEIRALVPLRDLGCASAEQKLRLARAFLEAGSSESLAEAAYRDALELAPDPAPYRSALARLLADRGRCDDEAIRLYAHHLAREPREGRVGAALAEALLRAGRPTDAALLASDLAATHPENERFARLASRAKADAERLDGEIADLERRVASEPEDRDAAASLALAMARRGDQDDAAAAAIERAVAANPGRYDLLAAHADLLIARGAAEEAIARLRQGAEGAARRGEHAAAAAPLAAIASRWPDHPEIRWILAGLRLDAGDGDGALAEARQLVVGPSSDPNRACAELDRLLARQPEYAEAHLLKGRALEEAGRFEESRAALEEAYRLRPSCSEAAAALVRVYQRLLDERPNAFVRFRLGKLHWMNQDYDRAIGCFQKTVQDYRLEADSARMLGRCFMARGMLDLALQDFRRIPMDEEAKELLYGLARRYEAKTDLVGAKTVYRQLFAADIEYRDVRIRFEQLAAHTSDPLAGDLLAFHWTPTPSRYELIEEIGRGAGGIVYRARDRDLEDEVAVKVLPESATKNSAAARRFEREAEFGRALDHPGILRVLDATEHQGRRLMAMELAEGGDLRRLLRERGGAGLPLDQALAIGEQIARALDHAHALGIVHGDVKPSNILLAVDGSRAKLADFGLATRLGGPPASATPAGTPLYMAPELWAGNAPTPLTDLYALGATLLEAASGEVPFNGGDLEDKHRRLAPQRPPGLDEGLWDAIARCLRKDPKQRYPTAAAFAEALRALKRRPERAQALAGSP